MAHQGAEPTLCKSLHYVVGRTFLAAFVKFEIVVLLDSLPYSVCLVLLVKIHGESAGYV